MAEHTAEKDARCPNDGQTLAWHLQAETGPRGEPRTNAEFIGCDWPATRARACLTCNGWNPATGVRQRETVGLVCQTCGWDYGENGEPTRVIPPGSAR